MCWREYKTGLDCYTNDKKESEFMCEPATTSIAITQQPLAVCLSHQTFQKV